MGKGLRALVQGTGPELKRAVNLLEEWRANGGGRGRPIPVAVWHAVLLAAKTEGASRTSKTLGIGYRQLKDRLASTELDSPKFVEVGFTQSPVDQTVVELAQQDGRRMRVQTTEVVDVSNLVQVFLEPR